MEVRSFDELREADERTLPFSPLGLGGKLKPQDAAEFQQHVIADADLVPAVPQRVRDCYERLRTIHSYGVLCYDLFTVAHDQARLALEFALRERFIEFHDATAQFRDNAGHTHDLAAADFHGLQKTIALQRDQQDEWRLVIRRTGKTIRFDGMLDALFRWAREEGLLRGQRNRLGDRTLTSIRNYIAHGAGDYLLMPVNSASTIRDTAEIINQLWGTATPDGRRYPAPIQRDIQLVGWSPREEVMSGAIGLPIGGAAPAPQDAIELIQASVPGKKPINDWTWVIVRAVLHDEGLMRFDSQFDVTTSPCDFLWGPGSITDALAWAAQELPQGDTAEVLDRLFAVQYQEDRLYLPRRPEIMLALPKAGQTGKWYLIRADDPENAFMHVRNIVIGGHGCSSKGACQQCAAETVRKGTWKDVTTTLAEVAPLLQPLQLPDVRATSGLRWPRYQQVHSDGTWTLGDR